MAAQVIQFPGAVDLAPIGPQPPEGFDQEQQNIWWAGFMAGAEHRDAELLAQVEQNLAARGFGPGLRAVR